MHVSTRDHIPQTFLMASEATPPTFLFQYSSFFGSRFANAAGIDTKCASLPQEIWMRRPGNPSQLAAEAALPAPGVIHFVGAGSRSQNLLQVRP
jgi:hypothetical protein